mmetsp:Transcript_28079/g.71160  ORF Transcript_28079/g.71160 Transcript_28079/m.71160 type:complete len:203 (+) Transcript_28079:2543-3151(+)
MLHLPSRLGHRPQVAPFGEALALQTLLGGGGDALREGDEQGGSVLFRNLPETARSLNVGAPGRDDQAAGGPLVLLQALRNGSEELLFLPLRELGPKTFEALPLGHEGRVRLSGYSRFQNHPPPRVEGGLDHDQVSGFAPERCECLLRRGRLQCFQPLDLRPELVLAPLPHRTSRPSRPTGERRRQQSHLRSSSHIIIVLGRC